MNNAFPGMKVANRGVTVVDSWALFAGANGDARAEEFPDLLHPNAVGF